jgi:hypothetical protein
MKRDQKNRKTKPIKVIYDETLQCWCCIPEDESAYPVLWNDREAGTRKIIKTKRGGVHMT